MKTLKQVPIGYKHVLIIDDVMQDGIMYISKKYKVAVHKCLCGCGMDSVMSIDEHNWHIDVSNGKLTVTPSVLNKFCGSHYIITNGIANFV